MVLKQITSRPNSYSVIAVAMFLVLGGWGAYTLRLRSVSNAVAPPVAGSAPVQTVAALGRVEPTSSVIKLSVANAQDSRVNQLLVTEGEQVEANQVIATLQGIEQKQAEVAEAKYNVEVQQAKLLQAETAAATPSQQSAQRATIRQLEAELRTTVMQDQAAIEGAEATRREAEAEYARYRELFESGAISASDLDGRLKDLETAQANLQAAKSQLANTQQTLSAQIQAASETLKQLGEVRPVDVAVAQAELEYAQSQWNRAQADLQDFHVRVPVAGQILRINTRVGERVNPDEGIVDLGQTDQMVIIAEVYETDVSKLVVGQQATITSENGGFSETLHGTVESIGLQIRKTDVLNTDPAADANARVVEVKIKLDPTGSQQVAALTYMQVRVKIQVD